MDIKLLSVEQAAERLGIRPGTLRHWLCERRIKYVKLGRRTLLDPRELEKLIEKSTIFEAKALPYLSQVIEKREKRKRAEIKVEV